MKRQLLTGIALAAAGALALAGCSNGGSDSSDKGGDAASYKIGISQLVQHPALDAATAGFQKAFDDAGVDVEFDVQNANGEQATAVTIAQTFASQDLDLVLAVATPAAQAVAQAITDKPVSYTHLDVYKRQGAGRARPGCLDPAVPRHGRRRGSREDRRALRRAGRERGCRSRLC